MARCSCSLVTRIVFLVLLIGLIPSGYLTYQYYLKPWGEDQLKDYANAAIAAANGVSLPDLSGNLVDGVACIKCPGLNNVYPVTEASHPSYGGFQKTLINNGGWFTSMLMTVGVAIGGGGSLLITLLNAMQGVTSSSVLKPASSTAQNGCGIFEMVFMISQAQFITMLGSLQLKGAPLFFYAFVKKLAWTNVQIFPSEASFDPSSSGSSRRLATFDPAAAKNATGVERYALLIGAKPQHLFYYTCVSLAVALGAVLVAYLVLRLAIGACKRTVAATLDHRVIWVYLQFLLLVQYVVAMTACFQIYYTATASNQSTADFMLAIVILAAACVGLLAFGIVKVARHRDEINTHGTSEHDDSKPFHLRYSVFYQDFKVDNVYFFIAKMLLDIASGAVVGTVQDAALQIAILVTFNAAFLVVLIWRQPFLVPLFYYVAVFAGYFRIALLLLTLVHTDANHFPQDVRDYVGVLIIAINAVLLICVLIRQFYALSVAIFRWASRAKNATPGDEEMGIPLQDMSTARSGDGVNSSSKTPAAEAATGKPVGSSSSRTSAKTSSSKSRQSRDATAAPSPIPDDTLFASQPYHKMKDDQGDSQKGRHSLPGSYSAGAKASSSMTSKGGGRRSLYSNRSRKRKEYKPATDDELPDWAKV